MAQSSELLDTTSRRVFSSDARRAAGAQRKRRTERMRWVRRTFLLFLVLALLAAIVVAWMPRPLPVEAAAVARGPLRVTVDEDGKARIKDRFVISAPLGGSVERITLHAGDAVRAGDVLARLVPAAAPFLDERTRTTAQAQVSAALAAQKQAKAQVERARANADYVKIDTGRKRDLFQRGSIARAEWDRATMAERSANADLDSAEFAARVADYEIEVARSALRRVTNPAQRSETEVLVSPTGGRVLAVLHENAGVVQPGAPLIEIGDPAAMEIVVDVLTSDAVKIDTGARVVLDGWGGEPLEGRVRRVEPSAFTRLSALGVEEQRVNVLVDVISERSKWSALNDGYRVEAAIIVWEALNVTKVPASAVFRRGDSWALFRIDGGIAHLIPVHIGHRTTREVEVLDGKLTPGARVILHPSDRVGDGTKVVAR